MFNMKQSDDILSSTSVSVLHVFGSLELMCLFVVVETRGISTLAEAAATLQTSKPIRAGPEV